VIGFLNCLSAIAAALISVSVHAQDPKQNVGPITKSLQGGNRSAIVTLDPPTKNITVRLTRPEQEPADETPESIEVTLFGENENPLTFELKAQQSAPGAASSRQSTYQGRVPQAGPSLSLGQQSSIGIELKIPLSRNKRSGKSMRMRSVD
jgi:hypothetical protein